MYPLQPADHSSRIPALVDHASGDTIWESDAILVYLVEKYDTEHKLSFPGQKQKIQTLQWLFFQGMLLLHHPRQLC